MNIDFHYYGTYVAARLAGYDFKTAQTIAHAAQYVDDSDMSKIFDPTNNEYYITDFEPVPTVQFNLELIKANKNWSEEGLNKTARTWASFHFLPANYGANPGVQGYSGPSNDEGLGRYWEYDKESQEQFKLLCLPNSQLAKEMINDIIQNHRGREHEIHITGLRMHVLADTWAHTYYAGIPAWFINNAGEEVYSINDGNPTLLKWNLISPLRGDDIDNNDYASTPDMPTYNSYTYLGHGRMGHLPDYPWIKYQYTPQWSNKSITKDNPSDFMKAFKQMVGAMSCIRTGQPFKVNVYTDIGQENEAIISSILNTKTVDQSDIWRTNISRIKVNNKSIEVPENYDANIWLNTMKASSHKDQTDYYKFNLSATSHANFVKGSLRISSIFLGEIPNENILRISLRNKELGNSIGLSTKGLRYYYPIAVKRPYGENMDWSIIKPNSGPLCSGDIVKIKTTETSVGQQNYLGAWGIPEELAYYTRDYYITKQKWEIIKEGRPGSVIDTGDTIMLRNIFHRDKYMYIIDWNKGGEYLGVTNNTGDNVFKWFINFNSSPGLSTAIYYNIVAKHSGKCIAVKDGSMDDSAHIIQCQKNGADNQLFRFVDCGDGYYNIVAKHSGKSLSEYRIDPRAEGWIVQYQTNEGSYEKFKLVDCGNGYYNIVASCGKCFDVYYKSLDDGVEIRECEINGGDNQRFKFVPAPIYYNIVAKHSGKCITVKDASMDDFTPIIQWDINGEDNQKFKLVDRLYGYYNILPKHSGKGISVRDASREDLAPIIQEGRHDTYNELFTFINCGDGYYNIVAKHSGKCLEVCNKDLGNGAEIRQYSINDEDNKKFKLVPVPM